MTDDLAKRLGALLTERGLGFGRTSTAGNAEWYFRGSTALIQVPLSPDATVMPPPPLDDPATQGCLLALLYEADSLHQMFRVGTIEDGEAIARAVLAVYGGEDG